MTEQAISERINALLARMTIEEKVAQMVQVPVNRVSFDEACEWAKRGAGSFLHVLGDKARELQRIACHTRLGIPVLFGIDAVHGHALNDHATVFPSQLAMACSWDQALVEQAGTVTAREVATDGLHWTFSPVLCLGRDARWGRVDETFGEDPYLAGELGAALVRGYQGDSLSDGEHILACAKHYIGYGEAVGARDSCDTEATRRKVREVFLPPFAKAVKAGCGTVMTAYGSLDGTPCTIDAWLLKRVLRQELGFDGFVVTDWNNVASLVKNQRVCETLDEAAKKAADAGNDMIMTTLEFYDAAVKLAQTGALSQETLNRAAGAILRVKARMGLFEQPEKRGRPGCVGCQEHRDAALKAARESIVLLKNGGMLPFKQSEGKIAVVGPNADDLLAQYGDWTYFSHPNRDVNRAGARPYVTLREGMEQIAQKRGVEIVYAKGCGVVPSEGDGALIEEAVGRAEGCGAIVLALGDRFEQLGEGKDRADLALSGRQMELFDRLRALNIPLCLTVVASKPLCLGRAAERADAVVAAFNGGMYGGLAAAEALFGLINPSGRLPVSFAWHSGQMPAYYNALPGWHGGKYVDQPAAPQFAFGEGLSYSVFRMERLAFDAKTMCCAAYVHNDGPMDGTQIVQVYFRDEVSSVMTPVKRLIAFKRVCLSAGETKRVLIQLEREDFSLVTADEKRVVEPGEFTLMVGFSSKHEDLLTVSFRLE